MLSSFHYHYARLIEILYCRRDASSSCSTTRTSSSTHVRAHAGPNSREGVGVAEAPRGTLIHHYRVDEQGLITWANLIIATGHNNLAMNRGVLQVAKHFVDGDEAHRRACSTASRRSSAAYDPCLSCSTHAAGPDAAARAAGGRGRDGAGRTATVTVDGPGMPAPAWTAGRGGDGSRDRDRANRVPFPLFGLRRPLSVRGGLLPGRVRPSPRRRPPSRRRSCGDPASSNFAAGSAKMSVEKITMSASMPGASGPCAARRTTRRRRRYV